VKECYFLKNMKLLLVLYVIVDKFNREKGRSMRKKTLLGIILAIIGMGITIYGLSVSTDLAENRVFRMTGYGLTLIGIFITPEYKKSE
jgi:hypothetical protein